MHVGKHKNETVDWKLGGDSLKETTKYKYLGDIITADGKNDENIQARKAKTHATTVTLNTIASSDILHRIETAVLLILHESKIISSLLTNAESWCLRKKDEEELEKIEIQAMKYVFDLPIHMPTAAIIYSFGLLYTTQRIDQIQLVYLHKIIQKESDDQIRKTLEHLKERNIGCCKKILATLEKYHLTTDFDVIREISPYRWKNMVSFALEQKNTERLNNNLYKIENGQRVPKTKTRSIAITMSESVYTRKPDPTILQTKQITKTILIARYGMLDCGNNFKGKGGANCVTCNKVDDENHRLNESPKWINVDIDERIDFDLIYCTDIEKIHPVLTRVNQLWNTKCAHGSMHNKP